MSESLHYVLESDGQNNLTGSVDHLETENRWELGFVFPPLESALTISLNRVDDNLPDFFVLKGVPVVSHPFLSALNAMAIDNWDAYPVHFTQNIQTQHVAFNILGALLAMDEEASEYTLDSDQEPDDEVIDSIKKLVLKTEGIEGFHLFRLAELPTTIIVTDTAAERLQHLKGIRLTPVAEWVSYQY